MCTGICAWHAACFHIQNISLISPMFSFDELLLFVLLEGAGDASDPPSSLSTLLSNRFWSVTAKPLDTSSAAISLSSSGDSKLWIYVLFSYSSNKCILVFRYLPLILSYKVIPVMEEPSLLAFSPRFLSFVVTNWADSFFHLATMREFIWMIIEWKQ